MQNKNFEELLKKQAPEFAPVVPFEPSDGLLLMDFTAKNKELTDEVIKDTNKFIRYINSKLQSANTKYGIGGYDENRTIYRRSSVFNAPAGPEYNQPPLTPTPGENSPHPASPTGGRVNTQPMPIGDPENIDREFYWEADVTVYKALKVFVSEHRKNPTKAEAILWQHLRGDKLDGYSFRRQHIIGTFIVDFVCLAKKLIVEVDGLQHQLPQNQTDDADRTFWLQSKGYTVLRFSNNEVLNNTSFCLQKIKEQLMATPFAQKLYQKNNHATQSRERSADPSPVGKQDGASTEQRTLHLSTDIWGAPYTKVMAPLNGIVHSFAFNNAYGDYGATIILTHNLNGESFHTLYGHLSLNSIKNLHEGDAVYKGDVIAEFGIPFENGQWPPHLHFQVIKDMQGMKGDYPGVCTLSERERYLANCPDADLILGMMKYGTKN